MIRYEYEQGFCKQLHYNGLWRVQYEGVSGHLKKLKWLVLVLKMDVTKNVVYWIIYQKLKILLWNGI